MLKGSHVYNSTAAPLCDAPNGGVRSSCLVCGLIKLSSALSRICYATEPPNEMECSAYDVHCDEDAVVDAVKAQRAQLDEARTALEQDAKAFRAAPEEQA